MTIDDVKSVTDPLSKVKAGLHGGGAAVPLQAVHVRAKLMDLAAQVFFENFAYCFHFVPLIEILTVQRRHSAVNE